MVRNSVMETTFYEEQVGATLYAAPTANRGLNGAILVQPGPVKRTNLTLDLNSHRLNSPSKRPKLGALPTPNTLANFSPSLIPTPDLLKLGSPEFEKLFAAQHHDGVITTMPTPTSSLYFDKSVVPTEEQEQYARGFMDALDELRHSDSSQEPSSMHYTTLEPPGSVQSTESLMSATGMQIKDEPQTVPSVSSSPPMSPIDMESQEKIKLERKRQRNRVAASKCRRRKLERISRLEDKVKALKGENSDLSVQVNRLRDHVSKLKEQVIEHMQSGCQINQIPPGIF